VGSRQAGVIGKETSMALVFQYGSNASAARLNSEHRLNGRARFLGAARTQANFELGFTVWSRGNACAAADLVPGRGRQAWGAIYDIPEKNIYRDKCPGGERCLDQIEGEGSNYERVLINVHFPEEEVQSVFTYVVRDRREGLHTSMEYGRHILDGLQEIGAPADYLAYVRERMAKHLHEGGEGTES